MDAEDRAERAQRRRDEMDGAEMRRRVAAEYRAERAAMENKEMKGERD